MSIDGFNQCSCLTILAFEPFLPFSLYLVSLWLGHLIKSLVWVTTQNIFINEVEIRVWFFGKILEIVKIRRTYSNLQRNSWEVNFWNSYHSALGAPIFVISFWNLLATDYFSCGCYGGGQILPTPLRHWDRQVLIFWLVLK